MRDAENSDPGAVASRPAAGRRSSSATREHIVAVAGSMFYADGIHATGVDALAKRAGVAPTTLYRLFAGKDDLVLAYIERCGERYRAALGAATVASAGAPQDRILAAFDAFAAEVGSGTCRGCPFLMALAEYPDPDSPVHLAAAAHKQWLRDLFHRLVDDLATAVPVPLPESLADQIALVAEGVYGSAQALGPDGPAAHGHALVKTLLDAASQSRAQPTVDPTGR